MVVSQVARFVHKLKRLHELALLRIGQYLKGTVNKGLIMKPKVACSWGTKSSANPDCVKS